MLTTMFILILQSMVAHAPLAVRTTVADGSVWADSWRGNAIAASQRLRAPTPGERWLAADVDGDGRTDLVALVIERNAPRLEVWIAGPDGFVRR